MKHSQTFLKTFFWKKKKVELSLKKVEEYTSPKRNQPKEKGSNQLRSNLTDNYKSPYILKPKGEI